VPNYIEPHIDFINASTVVSDDEAKKVMHALRVQADDHYRPIWGMGCSLRFITTKQGKKATTTADPNNWQLIILDNSDEAGALGYHDLTSEGKALGKIFAKTDLDYGLEWSVTASHELHEMLGDPYINLTAQVSDTEFYAYENCDACEADEHGYNIGGVRVSDFVYPTWFIPGSNGPYDYCHRITYPLELLEGGYISVWTPGVGWRQQTNFDASTAKLGLHRPTVGTRRERRRTPKYEWMRSQV
jgi:hypothetical protein